MTQSRPNSSGLPQPPFAVPGMARAPISPGALHDVKEKLREVGLRPTRQRMALGWILFAKGRPSRHRGNALRGSDHAKVPVSLATVYNTLHQFTEVGLLRQVASTARRPISTPTIPSTTTSSSKTRTISWISRRTTSSSARRQWRRRGMRSPVIDVVVRLRRKQGCK